MEAGRGKAEKKGTNDVVLQISTTQESFFASQETKDTKAYTLSKNSQLGSSPKRSKLELIELENSSLRIQTSTFATSPSSSDIARYGPVPTPTLNKPPKIPTSDSITRRKSLARSEFSKPKSRLVEPPYPNDANLKEEKIRLVNSSSPSSTSPNAASPTNTVSVSAQKDSLKSAPITPKTPLIGTPGPDEEDDEEVYKTASLKVSKTMGKKWKILILFELTAFVCFLGLLVAGLTIDRLQNSTVWGLQLWKWCVLILVIFCGRLVTEWFINILVFLIERNFLLRKKVLYFVYGLKKSVQAVIWLGLVLLAWGLLFNRGVKRSRHTTKILNHITRALASCLIGAAIWLLKTLLVKLLASSFHVTRFFDRIQESIFHQYVLKALSGPPVMEMAEKVGSSNTMPGQLSFNNLKKQNEENKEEVIDVDKLKRMKHEKVSAWTMKGLINVITGTGLSTLYNALDQCDEEEGEQDKEITSEWEAKAAAYKIFRNVAKPGSKYIDEEDLLRFMKKEEVDNVILLFEGAAETGKIKRSALKNWLVNVYNERKSLAHSLNDTKTAIEELNKLASGIVLLVIIIVWLLMMGFLTTKVLVFVSSQLLLVAFMFGNTAKTVFEAIIFVFVMHPFDVGDRCVIDGVQMVVEEMNILTTVFLRYDNEKIFYPNSVLATKPISNFYRSPEMGDSVEFTVDVSTSIETIGILKARIKAYLESKPQHWRPGHSVQVKEIENMNKMKMALYVNHTINFQNSGDRGNRRSDLVLEMKKLFEELGIKYHLLPQEVNISYVGSAALAVPPLTR
ncbi:mechanosensitive ion channel protein 10-like [Hevea brasiliensis]|uniref:mechanosensitive ion channel protein 10-like n=1 Tax=Hevea brasiliensis TaxID=3981 RepID=UPI0025CE6590|nr:mechanosensitive ion channel protein 10-like [Hevea brasiliensis]XP_057985736.1 mechanosensitive ion channel protein 10-like [Hevea brasiliensis]XP_057985737.1 mechanosensitive ion channel protein 10-like [Hevea brasiliensis]